MDTAAAPAKTLAEIFQERLQNIEDRAKKVGLTLTSICRRAGVARATPDRWRKEAPCSIQLIDQLDAEVTKAEKAAAEVAA